MAKEEIRLGFEKAAELRLQQQLIEVELHKSTPSVPRAVAHASFNSVAMFAQYECGTAVFVSPRLVLTCAHCLGDEPRVGMERVLVLTSNGDVALARAIKVDVACDVALLELQGIFNPRGVLDRSRSCVQSFATLSSARPVPVASPLFCVGQPGRDDLESSRARKTTYNVVEVSRGGYQGCASGDVMDNSDIGVS